MKLKYYIDGSDARPKQNASQVHLFTEDILSKVTTVLEVEFSGIHSRRAEEFILCLRVRAMAAIGSSGHSMLMTGPLVWTDKSHPVRNSG